MPVLFLLKHNKKIRFIIVGAIGSGLDFLLFLCLYKFIELSYLLSNAISFHIALWVGFILQAKITFGLTQGITHIVKNHSINYFLLMYSNLLLSSLMLWVSAELMLLATVWTKLLSIVLLAIWSYMIQQHIIFTKSNAS